MVALIKLSGKEGKKKKRLVGDGGVVWKWVYIGFDLKDGKMTHKGVETESSKR